MATVKTQSRTLANDLEALLNSAKFSDVTLVAGETQLPAHRALLAARSPVFDAMFSHDTLETKSGHIEITDVEADVLRQLLVFLYTDEAPELQRLAPQLLVVADKYEVVPLREMCEEWMSQHLNVNNAAAVAVIAVQHSRPALAMSAVDFIRDHLQVMTTEGWKQAVLAHPTTVLEITQLLGAPVTPKRSEEEAKKLNEGLHRAAKDGDVDRLTELLEKGADLEARDASRTTALHYAALIGHNESVRYLLDKGCQVDVRDKAQRTPLYLAAMRGHVSVVRELLDASADVNIRTSDGSTPLHWPAANGHEEVVRVLLEAGARRDIREDRGRTPLDLAVSNHSHQVADLLRNG